MSSYCCCWWRWAFDLMDCLGIGHGHERDQQRNVNRVLPPAGMMIPFVDSFVSLTGVHVRFFCIAAGGRSSSSPRVARLLLVRSPIAILMLHTASQAQLHSSLYIPSTTSWFDYIMYRNSNILFLLHNPSLYRRVITSTLLTAQHRSLISSPRANLILRIAHY
jgi:hypothetical protein